MTLRKQRENDQTFVLYEDYPLLVLSEIYANSLHTDTAWIFHFYGTLNISSHILFILGT
jgi:hypothetical protein